jgi:hypothetical protein
MVKDLPYSEVVLSSELNQKVIRRFSSGIDDEELKWHRDDEDRIIYPVHETDWLIQLDNELPGNIKESIKIPKGKWHRLIKGTGDLELIIEKIYK